VSIVWKDISSHSQGDTDRTPKTWRVNVDEFRITVTRHINYAPGDWLLICQPFAGMRRLAATEIESAKSEAIAFVRDRLQSALTELQDK
jgi:hypothetical protein